MKKLLLFVILVVFFAPVQAQTLTQKVSRRAEQAALIQTRQTQIRKALQLPVFSRLSHIGWDGFLIENAVLRVPEDTPDTNDLLSRLFNSDCELFTTLFLGDLQRGNKRPDYAQETQNVKYIYVTDASDHGTKSIPYEVNVLLQQIRRARPKARILLALEFAVREDPHALPIHFAGEKELPFTIDQSYSFLIKKADKLDIDVLALDDFLLPQLGETPGFKMGDSIVEDLDHSSAQNILNQYDITLLPALRGVVSDLMALDNNLRSKQQQLERLNTNPVYFSDGKPLSPAQTEQVKKQLQKDLNQLWQQRQLLEQTKQALEHNKTVYLHDFISRSPWGMEQRNAQWAQYIEAISSFYDVIITYAGSGHLSMPLSGAALLPQRIQQPFVLFDFYTWEKLSQEDQEAYEQCARIQEEENSTMEWLGDMLQDESAEYCMQYVQKSLEEPHDFSHPFFLKSVYPSFKQAAGADSQRQEVLQSYPLVESFWIPHMDFTVYLPDYSKRCFFR